MNVLILMDVWFHNRYIFLWLLYKLHSTNFQCIKRLTNRNIYIELPSYKTRMILTKKKKGSTLIYIPIDGSDVYVLSYMSLHM